MEGVQGQRESDPEADQAPTGMRFTSLFIGQDWGASAGRIGVGWGNGVSLEEQGERLQASTGARARGGISAPEDWGGREASSICTGNQFLWLRRRGEEGESCPSLAVLLLHSPWGQISGACGTLYFYHSLPSAFLPFSPPPLVSILAIAASWDWVQE